MNGITPEAREEAAEAYRAGTGWDMSEGHAVVDAFVAGAEWAAGWGPVSAPVRPTVEALAEALAGHQVVARGLTVNTPDECSCGARITYTPGAEDVSVRRARAFAEHQASVLAADHLWTEPAGDHEREAAAWERGWLAVDVEHVEGVGDINPISGKPIMYPPSGSVPTETEGNKE